MKNYYLQNQKIIEKNLSVYLKTNQFDKIISYTDQFNYIGWNFPRLEEFKQLATQKKFIWNQWIRYKNDYSDDTDLFDLRIKCNFLHDNIDHDFLVDDFNKVHFKLHNLALQKLFQKDVKSYYWETKNTFDYFINFTDDSNLNQYKHWESSNKKEIDNIISRHNSEGEECANTAIIASVLAPELTPGLSLSYINEGICPERKRMLKNLSLQGPSIENPCNHYDIY